MKPPAPFRSAYYIFTLILSIFLAACSSEPEQSPEEAVKAVLEEMELAAEKRSLSEFMHHVSEDYRDHQGQMKDDVQRLVQLQYIRNQSIHILTDIKDLKVDGQSATLELNAAMAARASDLENSLIDMRANTYNFSVLLRSDKDQKTWKVASVSWQRGWK